MKIFQTCFCEVICLKPMNYLLVIWGWKTAYAILLFNQLLAFSKKKHLYQNFHIDFSEIEQKINEIKGTRFPLDLGLSKSPVYNYRTQDEADKAARTPHFDKIAFYSSSLWVFKYNAPLDYKIIFDMLLKSNTDNLSIIELPLPGINIVCANCKGVPMPHNPGFINQSNYLSSANYKLTNHIYGFKTIQTFFFPYQCQKCKSEPIVFIVRREGLKLQLVGRSHIENINVPDFLPEDERLFYSDAVISYNSGKVLAGLLYLRTFIEQYMRRILNKKDEKISGDDLADSYAKLLDTEFPKKFTTLKKIYEELSIPLHAANNDSEQFLKSKLDILTHFDALRLFSLKKEI